MKIFIALPMNNMTAQEYASTWEKSVSMVKAQNPGAEIAESYCEDFETGQAERLAKNMSLLAGCKKAYFGDGWKKVPACKLEYQAAETFGISTETL